MRDLGTVQSYLFNEHAIISFDKEWIDLFGGLPTFRVIIDDEGKLWLQSQKVRRGCE